MSVSSAPPAEVADEAAVEPAPVADAEPFYFWEAEATPSEPSLEVPEMLTAGALFEQSTDDVLGGDGPDLGAGTPELFRLSVASAVPPTVEAAADPPAHEPPASSSPPEQRSRPSNNTPVPPQTIPVPTKVPARFSITSLLPSITIAAGIALGLGSGIAIGMRPHKVQVDTADAGGDALSREPRGGRAGAAPAEQGTCPRDTVAVDASRICIDRVEVSVAAYAACEEEGVCAPLGTSAAPVGRPEIRRARNELCNRPAGRLDHPANCISLDAAATYCAWNDRRLPRASEWTAAWTLRGKKAIGTAADPRANLCRWECANWWHERGFFAPAPMDGDDGYDGTSPTGVFKQPGPGPAVLDLEGNVSEWVISEGGESLALGSSFATTTTTGEPDRTVVAGGLGSEAIGFRCLADP